MAADARKKLDPRESFGRGGTEVGVARAEGPAARRPVSEDESGHITCYFACHEVNKGTHIHAWDDDSDPSAGYVAWLLWGGEQGRAWAEEVKAKKKEDGQS